VAKVLLVDQEGWEMTREYMGFDPAADREEQEAWIDALVPAQLAQLLVIGKHRDRVRRFVGQRPALGQAARADQELRRRRAGGARQGRRGPQQAEAVTDERRP
jgi:hypothetical protein